MRPQVTAPADGDDGRTGSACSDASSGATRQPISGVLMFQDRIQDTNQSGPQRAWYVRPAAAAAEAPQGRLTDLLLLLGVEPDERRLTDTILVPLRRVSAASTLFHEGAQSDAVHVVRCGTFKTLRIAEDGYEQVLGFAGRAEVLGFDALCNGRHPASAIALEEASVYALGLREIDGLRHRVSALDIALQHALSSQLARASEIAEVMAAVASEVRLARFLLQRSARMAVYGQSSRQLRLPMSRRDIASHLGVAHETVSRSFGELANWGFISVDNREIGILNVEALKAFARMTRGMVDDRGGRGGEEKRSRARSKGASPNRISA